MLKPFWCEPPMKDDANVRKAAKRAMDFTLGWFLEPVLTGQYPKTMRDCVPSGNLAAFSDGEAKMLKGSIDFLGVDEKNDKTLTVKDACADSMREDYHKRHLVYLKAMKDKHTCECKRLLRVVVCDNFEWAVGYTVRFGLMYVDYENQQKDIPKPQPYGKVKVKGEGEDEQDDEDAGDEEDEEMKGNDDEGDPEDDPEANAAGSERGMKMMND
ncbi:UNVERIFIED_CONTAM: Oleuropein beta-glucosidase [Sesamum calycinum]|uniref:Oleuropein beta-glucosidase n=1 Tax=Sesamum calycinum TaxID=2727403 RepID=A0AAW2JUR1_9LAMI